MVRLLILSSMFLFLGACGGKSGSSAVPCNEAYDKCMANVEAQGPGFVGWSCPQCQTGSKSAMYEPKQCDGNTGFCSCVNPETGATISPPSRTPSCS